VQRISDGVLLYQQHFPELQAVDIDLRNQAAGIFLCTLREANGKETRYQLITQ